MTQLPTHRPSSIFISRWREQAQWKRTEECPRMSRMKINHPGLAAALHRPVMTTTLRHRWGREVNEYQTNCMLVSYHRSCFENMMMVVTCRDWSMQRGILQIVPLTYWIFDILIMQLLGQFLLTSLHPTRIYSIPSSKTNESSDPFSTHPWLFLQ